MTEPTARRIVLALTGPEYSAAIYVATRAELRQANKDRAAIGRRYDDLKQRLPFLESAFAARVEFLTGLGG